MDFRQWLLNEAVTDYWVDPGPEELIGRILHSKTRTIRGVGTKMESNWITYFWDADEATTKEFMKYAGVRWGIPIEIKMRDGEFVIESNQSYPYLVRLERSLSNMNDQLVRNPFGTVRSNRQWLMERRLYKPLYSL